MFPIVAETYQYVVGVDTHARKHVATVVNNLGVVIATRTVRVTAAHMQQFVNWVVKITDGSILFAVEGTSSYGETLTKLLLERRLRVIEVKPPKTKSRGGDGKTDQIDSELAALSVLRLPVDRLSTPRLGDTRRSLRIVLGARRQLVVQQVASKNALMALLRGIALDVDARKPLSQAAYKTISLWRVQSNSVDVLTVARTEAKRLAGDAMRTRAGLEQNKRVLTGLVSSLAPALLAEPGIGPVTLAQVICSYSHKGRIHSPEAFVALAGTAPIPAASGNTAHYRLSRYGDRQLNHALDIIVFARMRSDEQTKQYIAKRTGTGLSKRDIKRSLKRYVARSLFRQLEACNIKA
ncbi:MAG TPA: transposase [Candidatus Dormibacteraeota bacterium]|nr:transposase [Candidatus Dormibacteraeota bacterium]